MTSKKKLSDFDAAMADKSLHENSLEWYEPSSENLMRVSGFPWQYGPGSYYRMPYDKKDILPEAVDYLSHHTAGGQIAFRTDSKTIAVRVELKEVADMRHMAATGQCGFDLYIGDPTKEVFASSSNYDIKQSSYEVILYENNEEEKRMKSCKLFFPLYQGVKRVEIGLESGSAIEGPLPFSQSKKIVIYGTSITQGGCASRSGMAYSNILSRKLNIDFVNLGFSGSGLGEPLMADLISEIEDVSLFILDYEGNSYLLDLRKTLPEFVRILKEKRPEVPILILSRIPSGRELLFEETRLKRKGLLDFQLKFTQEANDKYGKVYFLNGEEMLNLKDFHECTVDGSHPTDLGFYFMAKALVDPISKLIIN